MKGLAMRLRMAVIGVGHLGKEHARILAGMPEVELVGVADVNADQATAVARRCCTKAYTEYWPLLNLVDAVVLAVPTVHHHPPGHRVSASRNPGPYRETDCRQSDSGRGAGGGGASGPARYCKSDTSSDSTLPSKSFSNIRCNRNSWNASGWAPFRAVRRTSAPCST